MMTIKCSIYTVYAVCFGISLLSSVGAVRQKFDANSATVQSPVAARDHPTAEGDDAGLLKVNNFQQLQPEIIQNVVSVSGKTDAAVLMTRQDGQNGQIPVASFKAGEAGCSQPPGTNQQPPIQSPGLGGSVPLFEDGKYWSSVVEKLLPEGLTDAEYKNWVHKTATREVVYIENGTLSKCGRNGNAHAILDDGTRMCVRNSKLGAMGIVGELLAFQLARVMQIHTVPAIALSRVATNESSPTWGRQKSRLGELAIADGPYVALIQWIPGLSEARLPSLIQQEPHSVDTDNLLMAELDVPSLVTLAEWTDLVIFDYLTAHTDRMGIIFDAMRKTGEKWLIRTPIHNLGRNQETGALCIFDNECAFFVSYAVLSNRVNTVGQNITDIYDDLLKSVCVFRRSTVEAVALLRQIGDVGEFLYERVRESDPVARMYLREVLHDKFTVNNEILKRRIDSIYAHIQTCTRHSMTL